MFRIGLSLGIGYILGILTIILLLARHWEKEEDIFNENFID